MVQGIRDKFRLVGLASLWVALSLSSAGVSGADTVLFEFSDNLSDESAAVALEAYAFEEFTDNFKNNTTNVNFEQGAVALSNLQYLVVPETVMAELDYTMTVQLDLRFQFKDPITTDSSRDFQRPVLTTTTTDQRDEGFTLYLVKGDEDFELFFQVGEGSELIPPFPPREGYVKPMLTLTLGEWYDVSVIFQLAAPTPRIDFVINGAVQSLLLNDEERADIAKLINLLSGGNYQNQQAGLEAVQIFLGGFPVADTGCCDPRVHDSTLLIDSFSIQPVKADVPNVDLKRVLTQFTDHLKGDTILSDAKQSQYAQDFLSAFNYKWPEIAIEARRFVTTYHDEQGPIFDEGQRNPSNFAPLKAVAYFLKQWVFDNAVTVVPLSDLEGWAFEESRYYPGSVAPEAPRIERYIEVDATYRSDPGLMLNGQETILRPTGLYVPAGERIEITLDEKAVGQGIKAVVGLQRADLEATWTEFARFPRISKAFSLTQASLSIINPFGGGLYFEVPEGAELGLISVTITGAVNLPTYSTLGLQGQNGDASVFKTDLDQAMVPWFELVSDKFITTQPINARKLIDDPQGLLDKFGDMFDAVNLMAGRPLTRFRGEWLTLDAQVTVRGTAMAASYPTYGDGAIDDREVVWERDGAWFAPYQYLLPDFFASDVGESRRYQRNSGFILWHEWGHLHNLPTLGCQEAESNVHLLAAVIYNRVFEADMDTALKYSGSQQYNLDDSALDTMLSPSWQRGRRLCLDEWDNEVRYQTRSWARIVEIASMLGWHQVGAIHKAFYDRGLASGEAVNYGISDDDFVETASLALGLNLVPLFEFWGVPVSVNVLARTMTLPVVTEFESRLLHYKSIVPSTNAAFAVVSDRLAATTGSIGRWEFLNANFTPAMAVKMTARVDDLLCRYYQYEALCLAASGDVDADGQVNELDAFPFDSDNDDLEAGENETRFDLSFPALVLNDDRDGDGVADDRDAFPFNASESLDTDADGEGNNADLDDDNDGFTDEEELADGTDPLSRFSCKSGCFSFDVDENLEAQPLTDGLLVIRHLFGFSGDSLTSGAVSGEAGRDSSEAIAGYLTEAVLELDVDGDGESKPLTDGLLLIRYLFGFSGDSLISGAIGSGAERDTAEEVEAYIQERVPVQ